MKKLHHHLWKFFIPYEIFSYHVKIFYNPLFLLYNSVAYFTNKKSFQKFAFFIFLLYNIIAFIYLPIQHGTKNQSPWNPKSKSKKPLDFFFERKKERIAFIKKAFKNYARSFQASKWNQPPFISWTKTKWLKTLFMKKLQLQ